MEDRRITGIVFLNKRKPYMGDVVLTDRGIFLIGFGKKGIVGRAIAGQFGLVGGLVQGAMDAKDARKVSDAASAAATASPDEQMKAHPGSVFLPLEEIERIKWSVWWGTKIFVKGGKWAFQQPPKELKAAFQSYCQEKNITFA